MTTFAIKLLRPPSRFSQPVRRQAARAIAARVGSVAVNPRSGLIPATSFGSLA